MKIDRKGLALFLALTFVLTWAYEFAVVRPAALGTLQGQNTQLLVMTCMFFPAVCMLLTRLLTREGFGDLLLRPRFKGHVGVYLLAYFGPGVLILLGAAIYDLLFPGKLDWSAPLLRQSMAAAGTPYENQAVPMSFFLIIQTAQALLLGGVINLIPSLGEEWGWRGYLLPKLVECLPTLPALVASGVIWGLWHAPIIAMGHNYGVGYAGFPVTGILAMCLFCVIEL